MSFNNDDLISTRIENQYTPTGKVSSNLAGFVKHHGFEIEKRFVDGDRNRLQLRLDKQAEIWQSQWEAKQKSKKAKEFFNELDKILVTSIDSDSGLDWEKLKEKSKFSQQEPQFKDKKPVLEDCSPRPQLWDKILNTLIFKDRVENILQKQKENYKNALNDWKKNKSKYEESLSKWQKDKNFFIKKQKKYNQKIDKVKSEYYANKTSGIEKYYKFLLNSSTYPIPFPKKIILQYKKKGKILILEYFLPDLDQIPKVKEVKFIKTTAEFKETKISERQLRAMYDSAVYQITLRTIYEVLKYDLIHAVDAVVFNGWVNTLNQATGKRQSVCILSIQVKREEFLSINLKNVEPKICFKGLKGVAATKLSNLAPIAPILNIDKKDRRFIEELEVIKNLDDSANIAAMDWEDFEHLVREIFEKEFQDIGGEVKVTQSSRDKGVDAVVFDPDPIKGGKIILQAKRYTNTVKIESVRALYGIMQDEGAMKGILVTTSDFGADAYGFTKDKPITLLNGNNLLAILQKHGYKAKIDIKNAKKILEEKGWL